MTFRTILVGASGGSASDGAIDLACKLAVRSAAHLEAYHIRFDPLEVIAAASGAGAVMPMDGQWLDQMADDADKLAAKTRTIFFESASRHGLARADQPPRDGASAGWREDIGAVTTRVAGRARFFDLVILGRSDRVIDEPSSDAIEETLLSSGRPILLAPATPPDTIGQTVAIGWDGSPQSVRAMVAALPILRKAHKTVILTIGDKPDADADAARAYLQWHGITGACQTVPVVTGVGRGEQLLAAARDAGADLLAMGAFGHRPWRELLFGGATRTIVSSSMLPVLLTH
jgi:nucleotide-binding universal stress UspA family protein